jgi:hypothetical protein
VAAVHASQGPVLKASTRRDSALDCHSGLASRTARTLGGERRQFGRRRLRSGHGILNPARVGAYLKRNSGAGGSTAAAGNVSRRGHRDRLFHGGVTTAFRRNVWPILPQLPGTI